MAAGVGGMSVGVVVLARADSRRLPGKVLMDVAGQPLLARVVDRARRVAGEPTVVVATSDRPVDDPVAELASAEGAPVYRGSAANVLERLRETVDRFGFDSVVRVSGDSPFWDPAVGTAVLAKLEPGVDLATNVHPRTFPVGMSAEVFPRATLARLDLLARNAMDREHVTRAAYRVGSGLRIANVACGFGGAAAARLAVDDARDLARARWIAARAENAAGLVELLELASAWDEEVVHED
jgi:spore coat polysaccharide biosynthesis protein SpsF